MPEKIGPDRPEEPAKPAEEDIEAEMQRLMDKELSEQKETGGDTKPLSPEEERKEQEMLRMVDEEMEKTQSSEAQKTPEAPAAAEGKPGQESEKVNNIIIDSLNVYADARNRGESPEEAKRQALDKFHEASKGLSMPDAAVASNRLIEGFKTDEELRRTDGGPSHEENPVAEQKEETAETPESKKITPEMIKSVAAKVHEAWRDAVDLGVPPAEAGAVAKAMLNELTEGNPELKRLVNQKFEKIIKTAEAKKAAGPEDLPVLDRTETETVSGPDLLEQWAKEGILIPEVAAGLGLTPGNKEPEPTPEEKDALEEARTDAEEVVTGALEAVENPPPAETDAIETPAELKPLASSPEATNTVEQIKIMLGSELGKFGLSREEIKTELPGFEELSIGRQLLVVENLKQVTLGRIKEEAKTRLKSDNAKANAAQKIFRFMFRKGFEAKTEKETAAEIIHGGLAQHKDILEQLIMQAPVGPEAKISPEGKLEIVYIDVGLIPDLTDEQKQIIANFNQAARAYAQIPYAESIEAHKDVLSVAGYFGGLNKVNGYTAVFDILASKLAPGECVDYLNQVSRQIAMDKFLNTNPEVDKALQNIQSQSVWWKALTGATAERAGLMTGGFVVRAGVTALLGVVGMPITIGAGVAVAAGGAVIGGYRARQRTKEGLKETEEAARHGQEKTRQFKTDKDIKDSEGKIIIKAGQEVKSLPKFREVPTISQFVKAEKLTNACWNLFEKIEKGATEKKFDGGELTPKKKSEQLHYLAEYIRAQIEKGTINFGATEPERIRNQYGLIQILALAETKRVEADIQLENSKRVKQIIERQKDKAQQEKGKQLMRQMLKGAAISGAFASVGYLISHLGEERGWWPWSPSAQTSETGIAGGKSMDFNEFETALGIDTKNGISAEELKKMTEHYYLLKGGSPNEQKIAATIFEHYRNERVGSKTFGQFIHDAESSRHPEAAKPEPAAPSGKVITPIEEIRPAHAPAITEIKPSGGGVWEDTIDSSRVGVGRDSVWKSTKEIFLYHNRDLNYPGPKDAAGNPIDGADLDAWAETKTANLVEEWTKTHGGQSPDIVHDGDKVVVEFDKTTHQPHLKIYEAKNNGFEEITEAKGSTAVSETQAKEIDEDALARKINQEELDKIIHGTQEDATKQETTAGGMDQVQEIDRSDPMAELNRQREELRQTEARSKMTPFERFEETYNTAVSSGKVQSARVNAIREYIGHMTDKSEYHGPPISGDKLTIFAHITDNEILGKNKLEEFDTMAEITKAIQRFDKNLERYTHAIITGKLRMPRGDELVPIQDASGKEVYFVKPAGGIFSNKWTLSKINPDGTGLKEIENPINRSLFSSQRYTFTPANLRRLLGFEK